MYSVIVEKYESLNMNEIIAEYTEEISSAKLVDDPVVSVCFITYNHAEFIEEALDNVLAQKTDFSYEIVIGDDASTDGTSEIVNRYQREYPDKIKILRSLKNLGGLTGKSFQPNWIRNLRACRGMYIAMLEGDDYWTDRNKLQNQVDYLDAHHETAGCFTDCTIVNDSGEEMDMNPFWVKSYDSSYDQSSCLTTLKSGYGTATLMFHSSVIKKKIPDYFLEAGCDFLLDLVITEKASLDYLPGVTSAYRIHDGGIWQGTKASDNALSMLNRMCLLYLDESFRKRHNPTLDSSLDQWSLIYSNAARGEHPSLYQAISKYLSATSVIRPIKNFPPIYHGLTKLFGERWHDSEAPSNSMSERLVDVCKLYWRFPEARSLCLGKLVEYAAASVKRRLQ